MEIRGVGGLTPAEKSQSAKSPSVPEPKKSVTHTGDSLKVSDEVRFLEDEAFVKDVLARTPDVDQEKIDNIKKKLENGEYNNKETIDALAEKLIKVLGL
jgi:flagellar biosynthesis anti-sigma factor FlgM